MTIKRTKVSFRVFSPDLNPNEVSQTLGLTPDHSHVPGDYPRNNPKYSAYKHGMWILDSRAPLEDLLDAHLESILSLLEPKHDYLVELAQHHFTDFYCGLFSQSGFQLAPQLLSRIANLGAHFGVNYYP